MADMEYTVEQRVEKSPPLGASQSPMPYVSTLELEHEEKQA